MQRVAFLRSKPLFASLRDEQLQRLARIAEKRVYRPGAVIFDEDSDSSEMFIVKDGEVHIRARRSAGSGDVLLYALGPGQAFGWSGLWDDVATSGSALANTECTVLAFRSPSLHQLFAEDYELGYAFMYGLADRIGRRVAAVKMQFLGIFEQEW